MLKPEDGYQRGRADLRGEVAHLQRLLIRAGYHVVCDGFYGPATEKIIQTLQKDNGLESDGIIDDLTWKAIENKIFNTITKSEYTNKDESSAALLTDLPVEDTEIMSREPDFADFKGDLNWIHKKEGHAGKPYWPGGQSGITLDPGFDLGHQEFDQVKKHYASILSQEQLEAIRPIMGITGRSAKTKLNRSPDLLSIRINRDQASGIFPHIALPYWKAICKKIPGLNKPGTPASVQTAFLSLAFNRGFNNPAFKVLQSPLVQEDWFECARIIGQMQQDHPLEGIRKRRQQEADLIFTELS